MVKRRSMVVGIGALATGSGAVFSSAAFQSSVNPAADMRVVVGQEFGNNLRVDAGDIFRQANGNFNPAVVDSDAVNTIHDITGGTTTFFGSNELADIEVEDLPAAGANNDDWYNDDLSLAVATAVDETTTIGNAGSGDDGFIQVKNNTPNDHDIQIDFDEFGGDVTGGPVSAGQVRQIYSFYNQYGQQISPNSDGDIPNSITVESGKTEQIYLKVDTATEELYEAVVGATSTDDSPFTEEQNTVDLVNSIYVGVEEDEA